MPNYSVTRNIELSTLKYIQDNINNDWSGVSVVKTWKQADKVDNPVICGLLNDTDYTRKELGNTAFRKEYVFTIDIFATSDGQRIDLTDYLMRKLEPGWSYYTIEKGSGTSRSLTYTEAGRCRLQAIYDNTRVDIGQSADAKDRYHQSIVIAITVGIS